MMNKKNTTNEEKIEIDGENRTCGYVTARGTACKKKPEEGHKYCKYHLEHENEELNENREDMDFLRAEIANPDNIEIEESEELSLKDILEKNGEDIVKEEISEKEEIEEIIEETEEKLNEELMEVSENELEDLKIDNELEELNILTEEVELEKENESLEEEIYNGPSPEALVEMEEELFRVKEEQELSGEENAMVPHWEDMVYENQLKIDRNNIEITEERENEAEEPKEEVMNLEEILIEPAITEETGNKAGEPKEEVMNLEEILIEPAITEETENKVEEPKEEVMNLEEIATETEKIEESREVKNIVKEEEVLEELENIFVETQAESKEEVNETEEDEEIPILFNELEEENDMEKEEGFEDIGELLGNIDEDSDLSKLADNKSKNIFDDDILEELELSTETSKEEKSANKKEKKASKLGGIKYLLLKNKYKIFILFMAAVLISIIMIFFKPIDITNGNISKKNEITVEEKINKTEKVKESSKEEEKEDITKTEKIVTEDAFAELENLAEQLKEASKKEKEQINKRIEELKKKIKETEKEENKKMEIRLMTKIEDNISFTTSEIIKSNGVNVILLLKNKSKYNSKNKAERERLHKDLYKSVKTVFDSEEKVNTVNISVISEEEIGKMAELTVKRHDYEKVKEENNSYDTILSNFRLIER